jgi:TatD DNase family protein
MKVENLRYIDCHSHPHDKKYLEAGVDPDSMMRELFADGGATIAIGTDYKEIENALEFSKKYENCWLTIGIHPADNHLEVFDEAKLEQFMRIGREKIVGVGECGLDYFYFEKKWGEGWREDEDCKKEIERQENLFIQQIEFAVKYNLPLVIHGRPSRNSMDAYRDILDILEKYLVMKDSRDERRQVYSSETSRSPFLKGHAHFFVGNVEIAKRFLDIGFLLSFDGPITFTSEYDKVIELVPLDRIMIETDSPYAAPVPHRGQICKPQYVVEVGKRIADIKKVSLEEVLEVTKNNTIRLFALDK